MPKELARLEKSIVVCNSGSKPIDFKYLLSEVNCYQKLHFPSHFKHFIYSLIFEVQ